MSSDPMKSLTKIKATIQQHTIAELLLLLALVLQVLFLCYVNLSCEGRLNDYDASGAYVHILEIYKSHSLFPSTYHYATTMDVDSTVGLAAVLLGITGNIFLAQGLCNILVIFAYVFTLREIFHRVGIGRAAMYAAMTLVLLPYSMGMVGYWDVMFVGVAANTIRNLLPLLYLSVLLDVTAGERTRRLWGKYIVCLVLMLLTSISAGVYVMLYGILGLILCDLFLLLWEGQTRDIRSLRWLLHGGMALMCVLGVVIQGRMGFVSRSSEQHVILAGRFPDNLGRTFTGILEMFGALPSEGEVGLFSLVGIVYAIKYGIGLCFLGVFVYFLLRFCREKTAPRHILYLLFVPLLDVLVLLFLDTAYGSAYEYRYHIMPMLFVMVGGGFFLDALFRAAGSLFQRAVPLLLAVGLLGSLCLFDYAALLYVDFKDDFGGETGSAETLAQIDAVMEENAIDTAIIYSDAMGVEGRKLRAYGDATDYVLYLPSDGVQYSWGGSTRVRDMGGATGRTALITTSVEFEGLSGELQAAASPIGQVGYLEMYRIPEGMLDLQ